ncbi:MAG: hypothetical protein K2G88_08110, partial [Oscillospiraceae bacterium]|nr:hypothetical protein [Oscillospiraceae bacterium]
MMFLNQAGKNYPKLRKALRDIGVYESSLEIAEKYLDLENDRNDMLLEQIPEQDFSKLNIGYTKESNLNSAVENEINRKDSQELFERYILLSYAIAGIDCGKLGIFRRAGDDIYYLKIKKLIQEALKIKFMGEAEFVAQAIYFTWKAFNASHYNSVISSWKCGNESPTVCVKSLQYIKNYQLRLFVTLTALHNEVAKDDTKNVTELLAKLSFQKKIIRQQMLESLDLLIQQKQKYPIYFNIEEYLMLALAEASYFDKKYSISFHLLQPEKIVKLAELALETFRNPERTFFVLSEIKTPSQKYISLLAHVSKQKLKTCDEHLAKLAKKFPAIYQTQVATEINAVIAEKMQKIFKSVCQNYQPEISVKEQARLHCADIFTKDNSNFKTEIQKYLLGEVSTGDFQKILPNLKLNLAWSDVSNVDYVKAYGLDIFAERCICLIAILSDDKFWISWIIKSLLGYELNNNEKIFVQILRKHQVSIEQILQACSEHIARLYLPKDKQEAKQKIFKAFAKFMPEVLGLLDIKSLSIEARCLYIEILGENNKYQHMSELFAMTEDSSKTVRSLVINYLPKPTDSINEKLLALLNGKKVAQREIAVSLLEKNFPATWENAVQNAFEAEKNEKLKIRLGNLLGAENSQEIQQITNETIVDSLTKGNKAKKTVFLFKNAFTPVHTLE